MLSFYANSIRTFTVTIRTKSRQVRSQNRASPCVMAFYSSKHSLVQTFKMSKIPLSKIIRNVLKAGQPWSWFSWEKRAKKAQKSVFVCLWSALASKVGVHSFDRVRWPPRKPLVHFSHFHLKRQILKNPCAQMINLLHQICILLQYIITRDYKVKLMSKIYLQSAYFRREKKCVAWNEHNLPKMSKERRYTRLPCDSLFTILAFTCKKRFWWLGPLVFTTHKLLTYLEAASLPVTMADIVRLLAKSGFPKEQSTVNWFACVTKAQR